MTERTQPIKNFTFPEVDPKEIDAIVNLLEKKIRRDLEINFFGEMLKEQKMLIEILKTLIEEVKDLRQAIEPSKKRIKSKEGSYVS